MNAYERAQYNHPDRRRARERKARKAAAAASTPRELPSVGDSIRKSLGLSSVSTSRRTDVEALQESAGRAAILQPNKTQGEGRADSRDDLRRTRKPVGEATAARENANKRGATTARSEQPAPPRPAPSFVLPSEKVVIGKASDEVTDPHIICCGGCGYETAQHFSWRDAMTEYSGHRCDA